LVAGRHSGLVFRQPGRSVGIEVDIYTDTDDRQMRFPMSVIPTYVILAKFYQHLMLVAVILGMLQFMGYPLSIYFVQLPYFMFATLVLLVACALVTSTLSTIVRDVQMIVHSFMRILLYLTPILYSVSDSSDRVPEFVKLIMKVNPLYYIVKGYRAALLGTSWYGIEHLGYTVYFWLVIGLVLIIGSALHLKFRDRFVDYL
jgi:teichoic acid transport system permease protein